jgi:hypothetical protein
LRYVLKRNDIDAGVLSDRISVTKDCLKDVTVGYVCATYPYHRLFFYTPVRDELRPINSADDFLQFMRKESKTWPEYANCLKRWEDEI